MRGSWSSQHRDVQGSLAWQASSAAVSDPQRFEVLSVIPTSFQFRVRPISWEVLLFTNALQTPTSKDYVLCFWDRRVFQGRKQSVSTYSVLANFEFIKSKILKSNDLYVIISEWDVKPRHKQTATVLTVQVQLLKQMLHTQRSKSPQSS
jgi:hypothetical protein